MRLTLPECTYCGDECRETHDVSLDGYCSEECKAAAEDMDEDEDEPTVRPHHDECNCYTCHARWRKELNK